MNKGLLIAVAVLAAIGAFAISRGMSGGTNIGEREKYWQGRITEGAKPGTTQGDLQAFAEANGQRLRCYQNAKREDECEFRDRESRGGSRNLPMQLAVTFAMKDGKVVSHRFDSASAVNE